MPTTVQKPRVPILVVGFWPKKKPFQRGAQWDGLMPVFGMESHNGRSPEALVTKMLTWHHGITWFYSFPSRDWLGNVDERIRGGPPR